MFCFLVVIVNYFEYVERKPPHTFITGCGVWKRPFNAQLSIKPHFHLKIAKPVNIVKSVQIQFIENKSVHMGC